MPRLPLGLAVHPLFPVLCVGFTTINRVGVYQYDSLGHLQLFKVSGDSGETICWLTVNKEGTRLYASNTGDNSISVFDLSNPKDPTQIQHIFLRGVGSSFQFDLDDDDKFLHVVGDGRYTARPRRYAHVVRVNPDGTLFEITSSLTDLSLPDGVRSQGVVAF